MRRFRRPSKRVTVSCAALAVLLLCVGLFVHAYRDAAPHQPGAADNFGAQLQQQLSPSVFPTQAVSSGNTATGPSALIGARPKLTFTAQGGPGFTIVPAPRHVLVLSVRSAVPIGTVGYLVPTSPNHNYGTARQVGTRWSMRTTVTGKPYYTALFIQAGATGSPVTCSISLDGKVVDTKSTTGAYGRQVCVA